MKRLIVTILLLFVIMPTQSLSGVTLSIAYWACDGVGGVNDLPVIFLNIDAGGAGGDPEINRELFLYRVIDGNGDILADSGFNMTFDVGLFNVAPFALTITHLPQVEPVTIEIIDADMNLQPTGDVWILQADNPCNDGGGGTPITTDLSIGTELAAYGNEFGWTFYAIDELGNGYLSLVVYADTLTAYDNVVETVLVASSAEMDLYRLSTGYWQINLKATEDGHVAAIVFDTLPPSEVYDVSFNIYE